MIMANSKWPDSVTGKPKAELLLSDGGMGEIH